MQISANKSNLAKIIALAILGYSSGLLATKVQTLTGDDVDAMELRSIIVEPFEATPWVIEANPKPPESSAEINLVEGKPQNLSYDEGNKKSMGVRYQFVYPGNNTIVLTPPADKQVERMTGQLDNENKPKKVTVPGIELPGKVKAISVWVLGRGNEYTLEGWIEDWRGDTHILKMGSLDFIGWRPLSAKIPENIPQDVYSYPQTKTLVFKKFVIRSTPKTSQEKVVLFFDSLKVLTDMYDVHFDGADMNFDEADKEEKARLKAYEEQLKKQSSGGK